MRRMRGSEREEEDMKKGQEGQAEKSPLIAELPLQMGQHWATALLIQSHCPHPLSFLLIPHKDQMLQGLQVSVQEGQPGGQTFRVFSQMDFS